MAPGGWAYDGDQSFRVFVRSCVWVSQLASPDMRMKMWLTEKCGPGESDEVDGDCVHTVLTQKLEHSCTKLCHTLALDA